MRIIRLTLYQDRQYISYVDDEDYDLLSVHVWSGQKYASNYRLGKMHRVVLGLNGELEAHHIDGNGLNNTKANLRIVDRATNVRLQRPRSKTNYKGVYAEYGKFSAYINHRRIGTFNTVERAARAYDEAARKLWGSDCYLNFPNQGN